MDEVREKLRGSAFSQAPILTTAIATGRGLLELKSVIRKQLDSLPAPRDIGKPGDRFVIRDTSERATLAGGVVLDPESTRKKFRSARQQQFLVAANHHWPMWRP